MMAPSSRKGEKILRPVRPDTPAQREGLRLAQQQPSMRTIVVTFMALLAIVLLWSVAFRWPNGVAGL